MREWSTLFVAGEPLYDPESQPAEGDSDGEELPTAEQLVEDERKTLLDEGDFNEYRV